MIDYADDLDAALDALEADLTTTRESLERARTDLDTEVIHLRGEVTDLRSALETIGGPCDSGPWIVVYRDAGGGYEGLQAIAEAALGRSVLPQPATPDGSHAEAGE